MRPRDTRGFALPVTLFVVALLTTMLAAGFTRVRADRQMSSGSESGVRALSVAQNGLRRYLTLLSVDGCGRPIRPPDGDSVRINVPDGYADVVARVVQRPADSLAAWTYAIRATGHYIVPSAGSQPQARHTVSRFARWSSGRLAVPATFTAINGLTYTGNATPTSELRGTDQHPLSACLEPDRHPVRVPVGLSPGALEGYYVTSGLTPIVHESGTPLGVAAATRIDWISTVTGGFTPQYTTVRVNDPTYPTMLVTGNATLGTAGATTVGYGLLIVTGDLRVIGAYVQWYGVILVGGRIHFDAADQRFDGAIVSGLNVLQGLAVARGLIGDDNLDIDYDSQYVQLAMQHVAGFAPMTNTWSDNWAMY